MKGEKHAMQMQLTKHEFKQFFFHHNLKGVCHALVCLENQQQPY